MTQPRVSMTPQSGTSVSTGHQVDSAPRLFHLVRTPHAWILELQASVGSFRNHEAAVELAAVRGELDEQEVRHVIVDFHQVPYFGSSLLEVLLSIWSQEQLRAGTMSLCNVSAVGREILEVTRFDTLWTIYNTRAEALEAAAAG